MPMLSKLIILCFLLLEKGIRVGRSFPHLGSSRGWLRAEAFPHQKIQSARPNHSGPKALPSQDVRLIGNNLLSLPSSALFKQIWKWQQARRLISVARSPLVPPMINRSPLLEKLDYQQFGQRVPAVKHSIVFRRWKFLGEQRLMCVQILAWWVFGLAPMVYIDDQKWLGGDNPTPALLSLPQNKAEKHFPLFERFSLLTVSCRRVGKSRMINLGKHTDIQNLKLPAP